MTGLADPLHSIGPGARLGRYELLELIARGGMATVWLARPSGQEDDAELVAIKTMLTEYSGDAAFRAMFLDEARLASSIRHPNVVSVRELGEQGETLYTVMDYVEGESLRRVQRLADARGEALPIAIVGRILMDVCSGLHAAHELTDARGQPLDLVHRDVSPQNVLISTSGIVRVIDFGIAKARGRLAAETTAGLMKGKVAYMAPEQLTSAEVDRRADVWAVGAIGYELVTGKPLVTSGQDVERLRDASPFDAPSDVRRAPPALQSTLMRALSVRRDARFSTADEMRRALESALEGEGARASSAELAAYLHHRFAESAAARRDLIVRAVSAASRRRHLADGDTAVPAAAPPPPAATSARTQRSPDPIPSPRLNKRGFAAVVAAMLIVGAVKGAWPWISGARHADPGGSPSPRDVPSQPAAAVSSPAAPPTATADRAPAAPSGPAPSSTEPGTSYRVRGARQPPPRDPAAVNATPTRPRPKTIDDTIQ